MLHNKYKPKSFDQMIGNKEILSKLQGYIDNNDIPHCITFDRDWETSILSSQ